MNNELPLLHSNTISIVHSPNFRSQILQIHQQTTLYQSIRGPNFRSQILKIHQQTTLVFQIRTKNQMLQKSLLKSSHQHLGGVGFSILVAPGQRKIQPSARIFCGQKNCSPLAFNILRSRYHKTSQIPVKGYIYIYRKTNLLVKKR